MASNALKARLWKLFRITPTEQKTIELFQTKHPVFSLLLGKRLGTDHDHKTGLIRGLLEWRLNRALGTIEAVAPTNTPAVLRALADYLDNPPAVTALGSPRWGLIGKAMVKKVMIYGGPTDYQLTLLKSKGKNVKKQGKRKHLSK